MATAHTVPNRSGSYVSVDEYMRTSYEPDRDYLDGVTEERNVGEAEHSRLQQILSMLLGNNEEAWNILVYPECRLQVSETRFRVPDLLVLPGDQPASRVVRQIPLLCIEVLSPEDTLNRLLERVADYVAMGVRCIWIFNPESDEVLTCVDGEKRWTDDETLSVPDTLIRLSRAEIFQRFRKSLQQQSVQK